MSFSPFFSFGVSTVLVGPHRLKALCAFCGCKVVFILLICQFFTALPRSGRSSETIPFSANRCFGPQFFQRRIQQDLCVLGRMASLFLEPMFGLLRTPTPVFFLLLVSVFLIVVLCFFFPPFFFSSFFSLSLPLAFETPHPPQASLIGWESILIGRTFPPPCSLPGFFSPFMRAHLTPEGFWTIPLFFFLRDKCLLHRFLPCFALSNLPNRPQCLARWQERAHRTCLVLRMNPGRFSPPQRG